MAAPNIRFCIPIQIIGSRREFVVSKKERVGNALVHERFPMIGESRHDVGAEVRIDGELRVAAELQADP